MFGYLYALKHCRGVMPEEERPNRKQDRRDRRRERKTRRKTIRKARPLWRRALRWATWTIGGLILLLIVAGFALRMYFTDERIRRTAESMIHDMFDRTAHIGEVDFSLFSGITLDRLEVCDLDERGGGPFLDVEQVRVRYSLWPLITGKLQIDEVTVVRPRVYVEMYEDSTFSFSDLIVSDTLAPVEPTDTTVTDFPVTINLTSFTVEDAELHLDGLMEAHVRGASLSMHDLEACSPVDASALVHIRTDSTVGRNIEFAITDSLGFEIAMWASVETDAVVALDMEGTTQIVADVDVPALSASVTGLPSVRTSGAVRIRTGFDFPTDSLSLQRLLLIAAGDTVFSASGSVSSVQTDPTLDVRVDRSLVRLDKWNHLFRYFAPTVSVGGTVSLENSRVRGPMSGDLRVDGRFSMDDVWVKDAATGASVTGVNVSAEAEAHPFPPDPQQAVLARVRATVDEIAFPVDTATTLRARGLYGEAQAVTDTSYLPSVLVLSGGVADLLGGSGGFEGRFGVRGDPYNASGGMTFRLGPMDLSMLPGGMAKGFVTLDGRLTLSSLGDIGIDGGMSFEDVSYLYVDYYSPIPDARVEYAADAGITKDYEDVLVRSWRTDWPGLFSAHGSASVEGMGVGPIRFSIAEARAPVSGVMTVIPEEYQLMLSEAETGGEFVLWADATAVLPENPDGDVDFGVTAQAQARGISFHESANFGVDVDGLGGVVDVTATPRSAQIRVVSEIESANVPSVLDEPLRGITFSMDAELDDEYRFLRLRDASGGVRSHGLSMRASGEVLDLDAEPRPRVSLAADFLSTEPVPVAYGMTMSGKAGMFVNATGADSVYDLYGSFHFQHFSADLPDLPAGVTGATGRVRFDQRIDARGPKLTKNPSRRARTVEPILVDHDRWRVYESPHPGELADVSVERVEAFRVRVDNIEADVSYENNVLAVDRVYAELYGGNVLGALRFDVGDYDLGAYEPDLTGISFDISGIASSINVAGLVEADPSDTTESIVSANLNFSGTGVPDLVKPYAIEGELNVTRIGPKVTVRLLDFLDPTGTDVSIAQTRQLVAGGITGKWKPRWMSFRIAYGNVYPSLYLDQPFFAKYLQLFSISMPIEYSRIPLSTLMEQALVPVEERFED
jgi:hypothetical protein